MIPKPGSALPRSCRVLILAVRPKSKGDTHIIASFSSWYPALSPSFMTGDGGRGEEEVWRVFRHRQLGVLTSSPLWVRW